MACWGQGAGSSLLNEVNKSIDFKVVLIYSLLCFKNDLMPVSRVNPKKWGIKKKKKTKKEKGNFFV